MPGLRCSKAQLSHGNGYGLDELCRNYYSLSRVFNMCAGFYGLCLSNGVICTCEWACRQQDGLQLKAEELINHGPLTNRGSKVPSLRCSKAQLSHGNGYGLDELCRNYYSLSRVFNMCASFCGLRYNGNVCHKLSPFAYFKGERVDLQMGLKDPSVREGWGSFFLEGGGRQLR
ncbi:hypothetical protein CDAR_482501 [Caerostris darwini]|uniref:Uncharacterized protein n=1 Tax=Caerostris darwini TaxID=1538125 RepID=A0AAV4N700_9ARAC|nr:hypothetical protein CDAR_482501 [Caerostris darwini]